MVSRTLFEMLVSFIERRNLQREAGERLTIPYRPLHRANHNVSDAGDTLKPIYVACHLPQTFFPFSEYHSSHDHYTFP